MQKRRSYRISRQLARAANWLQKQLAAHPPGTTLAPIASLATQAGVAYVTMWKAATILRRQGLLDARPRRGIVVLRHPEQSDAVAQRSGGDRENLTADGHKWLRTCISLRRDLLRGYHTPGIALPSVKELVFHYGVCAATLGKALRELVSEGVLENRRCRYYPSTHSADRARHTVLLIARGDDEGNLWVAHPRMPEYMRALEHACAMKNVTLTFAPYCEERGELEDTGLLHRLATDLSLRDSILGVMVWQAGIDLRNWTDIVRAFAPLGKPMALLDEGGEYTVPRLAGTARRIRLYTLGFSAAAGRRMGRYLVSLGHRAVAFISPVHRAVWSRNRLDGLRMTFEEACGAGSVRSYVLDDCAIASEFLAHAGDIRTQVSNQLRARSGDGRSGDHLRVSVLRALQANLEPLLQREAYAAAMTPLLRAALADRNTTAWVAADDDTAFPCQDFLRCAGKRLPQDISLVGFDDSLEGSLRKLTSYDYNGGAYMRAMLAHVLSPGCPESGGSGGEAVEIEGTIVERRTTARLRPEAV